MSNYRSPTNPWGNQTKSSDIADSKKNKNKKKIQQQSVNKNKISEQKFKDAHSKNVEAAKKHVKDYESSSDEEELQNVNIIESVFKSYSGVSSDLQKTQEFLENSFQAGSAICLICIGTVKRVDGIWTCGNCFCFFHLSCIQRWANDSISLKRMHADRETGYYNNSGEYVPKKKISIDFDCPKCRTVYLPEEIPRYYTCFCGNETNPQFHPWLIPHSCGETCKKLLKPNCGHRCVLLCHPGPCPPCPQIITKLCKCEQSNPKTIRCSQQSWTCSKKCPQILSCGIHVCGQVCHTAKIECPPCKKRSVQKCRCGKKSEERNCSLTTWLCDIVCNKPYSCGLHKCLKTCHIGECGDCPLGLPRSCPCGKQKSIAPCSEQVDSCGGTCQKLLQCGIHLCTQRCHKGDCSQCVEIIEKKCRCGLYTKELPCHKQFTCEIKCKQIRECKKHPCNKKCCDNQCPPCDKLCGKPLSCGKHKCNSLCHNGECYPCNNKGQCKCRCGQTVIDVPCGRERKTKPPRCILPCRISSKCHHENPHRCHPNECPPCVQKCNLVNTTTKCEHLCDAKCHDSVKVTTIDKNFKPAGPWDVQVPVVEIKKLPHPPCEVKIPVTCIGGHEISLWPCHNSKPTSCYRECGRLLNCLNHKCSLVCHTVKDLDSKIQDDFCAPCQLGCAFPRPEGCLHPCKRPCHPSPCANCGEHIKFPCHCGIGVMYFKCSEFYLQKPKMHENEHENMLSCKNRCIKNYPCGHRCKSACHLGSCPQPELCNKKLKAICVCNNKKIDITCDKLRSGFIVNCDDTCKEKEINKRMAAEEKARQERLIEEEKNRQELEEFEKKFGKKKYKDRKKNTVEVKENNNFLYWIGCAVIIGIISVLLFYFIFFIKQ